MWLLWGFVLICQNFAFTFVSRARNSGSLRKHLVAGFFSNGVWFVSQIFAVGAFMAILSGHFGIPAAIGAGMFYTLLTLTGSLLAHQYALKTEKGAGRVGAHQNLASFTAEEGKMIRERVLFVDTGDGMGTFTLDEIGQLKTLIAHTEVTIPEENAEIVNESSPDGIRTGTITSDEAVSEVIREGYLPKDVMYPSIPITLLMEPEKHNDWTYMDVFDLRNANAHPEYEVAMEQTYTSNATVCIVSSTPSTARS